ncbi:hypothetical protein CHS0354_020490 [Potamilus streckersoni]|uniref:Uncharacterized protein n=1 Tax=Potamilus streckersoni TaxID=2493646 RepID=A0AAE0W457_9BIVA|nr:hypothetical protein CHS0354_020490 [Potamilus streckersoni]
MFPFSYTLLGNRRLMFKLSICFIQFENKYSAMLRFSSGTPRKQQEERIAFVMDIMGLQLFENLCELHVLDPLTPMSAIII